MKGAQRPLGERGWGDEKPVTRCLPASLSLLAHAGYSGMGRVVMTGVGEGNPPQGPSP